MSNGKEVLISFLYHIKQMKIMAATKKRIYHLQQFLASPYPFCHFHFRHLYSSSYSLCHYYLFIFIEMEKTVDWEQTTLVSELNQGKELELLVRLGAS
jgi:hypothetical protein